MAKQLSYQVIEDNGGGLHLAVFNGDECIWCSTNYEFIPDNLREDIAALQEGADPLQDNWQIIADESATYPERMGVAGRMVFGLDS